MDGIDIRDIVVHLGHDGGGGARLVVEAIQHVDLRERQHTVVEPEVVDFPVEIGVGGPRPPTVAEVGARTGRPRPRREGHVAPRGVGGGVGPVGVQAGIDIEGLEGGGDGRAIDGIAEEVPRARHHRNGGLDHGTVEVAIQLVGRTVVEGDGTAGPRDIEDGTVDGLGARGVEPSTKGDTVSDGGGGGGEVGVRDDVLLLGGVEGEVGGPDGGVGVEDGARDTREGGVHDPHPGAEIGDTRRHIELNGYTHREPCIYTSP